MEDRDKEKSDKEKWEFECGFTVEQVKDWFPDIPKERIAGFLECNDDVICEVMGEAGWRYITRHIRSDEAYN